MALATTYDHFSVKPITIPNAGPSSATSPEATVLNNLIAKCEPEFLKAILGYELYVLYIAGVDADDPDYLSIKNGDTYTDYYGVTQKWEGFTKGFNPIANYTYCQYVADGNTKVFNDTVRKAKNENSESVSVDDKIIPAWNEMVRLNFKLHEYLVANQVKFPSYVGLTHNVYRYNPACIQENQELFIAKNMFGI